VTVIVLAAGGGTRMKSKTMKVLHPISGRSMIGHVLDAVAALEPHRVVAVVGNQREQVGPHIQELLPHAMLAVQESQDGTGHAVRVAWEALDPAERTGTVLVAYGDTPLLEGGSLRAFAEDHVAAGRGVSILSGVVLDPHGYGRVLRDASGKVTGIVEQKDATEEQAAVTEINSGILAFDAAFLDSALPRLTNNNANGEYYLTDAVQLAREDGLAVGAFAIDDVLQTEGANDRAQLASLAKEKNRRILHRWMRDGVTIVDPDTTWIDVDVRLERDVTILPGVQLLGTTVVAEDAVVGPDSTLKDVEVGTGARVVRTHAELAVIGAGANVGPFSYLRPGTELGAGGKIGGFVETKNTKIGEGAKVPHLSYVGDAEIGEGTNVGAGTIFANYDGVAKHRTVIGRHARTASNNTFVAPVHIGDGAGTGAGSVIREDIPPGALGVSAGPQRNIGGWVARRRAGTAQAEAAQAAQSQAAQSEAAQSEAAQSEAAESQDRPGVRNDGDGE
jgi:bifunctional UDP-N-acetylglucosamine pyrophosphorylase/glucosamine-1-phosphate N-acetyltransferase